MATAGFRTNEVEEGADAIAYFSGSQGLGPRTMPKISATHQLHHALRDMSRSYHHRVGSQLSKLFPLSFALWACLALLAPGFFQSSAVGTENLGHGFFGDAAGARRSLWVVLVGTSRNWLNYRDNSNTVAMYRMFRRLGVPDSHIILMLGHSMACDPRNPHPGQLYVNPDHAWDLYGEPIEVDYRGAAVTVDIFLRVISGFHHPGTPLSKQLRSGASSDVVIYLTGHGGDKFLKFQDKEELQAKDLADAIHQMHMQRRYRSVLLLTDTCQADTMHSELRSPNIVAIASSAKGQNSYSYLPDMDLGVSVVDRFTFTLLRFLEAAVSRALMPPSPGPFSLGQGDNATSLQGLFGAFDSHFLQATPCLRSDLYPLPLHQVPALRYFLWPPSGPGSLQQPKRWLSGVDLSLRAEEKLMGIDWASLQPNEGRWDEGDITHEATQLEGSPWNDNREALIVATAAAGLVLLSVGSVISLAP